MSAALDPASAWGLALLRARGPLVRDVHAWRNGDVSTNWLFVTKAGGLGFGDCVARELVGRGLARIDGDRIIATEAAGAVALPRIPPLTPPPRHQGRAP